MNTQAASFDKVGVVAEFPCFGPRKLDANIPAMVMTAATTNARPTPVTKPTDSLGVSVV
jgi:hypothetical protein